MSFFEKKIAKIHDLLLEILERLNLKLNMEPTSTNISKLLVEHGLISEQYAQKISALENSKQFCDERPLLHNELNDIELYLLSRFYHYI